MNKSLRNVLIFGSIAGAIILVAVLLPNSGRVQAAVPGDFGFREGDEISADNTLDPDVYVLNSFGYKRLILSPTVMSFYGHLSFAKVKHVTASIRDAFTTVNLYRNCEAKDKRVFALEVVAEDSGILHWVNMSGSQAVAEDPNFFRKVFCINNLEFSSYGIGSQYTSVSQIPPYSRFGVGGGETPTPTPTPTPSQSPTPTPTPISGGVSIALASDNPASTTIPKGATAVPFLKLNVSNGNNTALAINNITVKRSGPGSVSDISNAYVFQGSNRLTFGQTFNSSNQEANFSNPGISIPANGSVTLSILADVSTSANTSSVHAFSISNLTASGVAATGNAVGNNMTIAGVAEGTVTITKSGVLSNPQLGAVNAEVAQFQLSAGSAEDVKFQRVILTNAGNIGSNLSNLKLKDKATGTVVATSGGFTSNNTATFDITNPVLIEKGTTKTYSVTGDIAAGARAGDTSRIYLQNSADLLAVGQSFGFGATVIRTGYDNHANDGSDASWVIIAPGQITVSFNGPSAKDIAKNAQNVEVFNLTLTSQVNAEIRQIKFNFDAGTGTANFIGTGNVPNYRNIKISDAATGAVVWGPQDFSGTDGGAGDTAQSLTFTGSVNINAGQSKTYKLTMNVANNADVAAGDSVRAILDMSGFTNQIRNVDNNTFVSSSDIVPSSNIIGNTMTVKIPSLNLSLATIPTSQTFVKGSSDVPFVGFNLSAGTASDVRISSIRITCYINASTAFVKGQDGTVSCLETVPSVRLKVDGVQVGDTKSPGAGTDGTATFSNLNLVIPAGSSKVVQVNGDVSSSALSNAKMAFDINSASGDVAASDQSGNTLTAVGNNPNGGTSPSRIVTVAGTGTLTVANAPTETDVTDSRIVPAGANDVTMSKIKFTAQNEELKLTKARILLESLAPNADVSSDVVTLSLFDGATMIAGPATLTPVTAVGTTDAFADFNTISPNFVIPKDGNKVLTVKANLNSISGGAKSGGEFRTSLDFNHNFEARGTSSSTVITTAGSADVDGNFVALRKSQPRVALAALPTTTLSNGNQVLMKFSVQASNNDVALKHIAFQTQSSNVAVALTNATVRESGTSTDISAVASVTTVGGTNTVKITFNSEQQVASGATKTYELRADVAGAGAGNTLTTRILGDSVIVTGKLGPFVATQQLDDLDNVLHVGNDVDNDGEYNFIWSDMSSIPHNDTAGVIDDNPTGTSNDWTNGRLIRLVPSDTQTLTFPG